MKPIKNILCLGVLLCISSSAWASYSPGSIATTLANQVDAWYAVIRPIFNKVAFGFGIVGGLMVFIQYAQGSDQGPKVFTKALIGLGIFALSATIIAIFVE